MEKIIFTVVASVSLLLLVLFFVIFPFARYHYIKKHFIEECGRRIYHLANRYDYYLINRLLLKTMDGTKIDIDHLLCGNKYIYVVHDEFIKGELYARLNDKSWIKTTKVKKEIRKEKIENMLLVNKRRITTFSQTTNLSLSLIVNIVIINDDCKLSGYEQEAKNVYLVNISSFKKLIKKLEKDNVKNIKENQLKHAIIDIANLNERKKNVQEYN